ncbi:glycosyltransferase [Patescibacteria group bacterium]|nr:glycosyltransferase [Patescibacteria group bacterium]
MLKVALIHDHLNQMGGAEKVLLALSDIFPDAPIYTLYYDEKDTKGFFANKKIITSKIQKFPFSKKLFKYYLTQMPKAIESFDLSAYDLVISSSSAFAKGVITPTNCVHICYCHTPTRYLWSDTSFYIGSLKFPSFLKGIIRSVLYKIRIWDFISSSRVDYFISNSDFVAKRIKKYYRRTSHTIYPPVDNMCINSLKTVDKPEYYIMVCRLRPYKKVDLVIDAFNKLGDNYKLKIIGEGDLNYYKSLVKSNNIEFLGYLPDEKKFEYLKNSIAFINPQEEDFGIAPVEAMMCGVPVIAYASGGALETVISGVTGEFFNSQDINSLVSVISNFDCKKFDREKIKLHAEKFSISSFKNNILEFVNNHL